MKSVLAESRMLLHFRLHTGACAALVAAAVWPDGLAQLAGVAFAVAACSLLANVFQAACVYRRHAATVDARLAEIAADASAAASARSCHERAKDLLLGAAPRDVLCRRCPDPAGNVALGIRSRRPLRRAVCAASLATAAGLAACHADGLWTLLVFHLWIPDDGAAEVGGAGAAGGGGLRAGLPVLVSGWATFYAGLALPMLLPVGLTVVACGWLAGAWAPLKSVRDSMSEHKTHAWVVLSALAAGASGLLLHAGDWPSMCPASFVLQPRSGCGAIWSRSSLPSPIACCPSSPAASSAAMSSIVRRSFFWGILAASLSHALAAMFDIGAGRLWPVDLAAALAVFWLAWRWQIHKVFVSHLLAMHHCAGLWLGMAFFLYALQGAAAFFGLGRRGAGGRRCMR